MGGWVIDGLRVGLLTYSRYSSDRFLAAFVLNGV